MTFPESELRVDIETDSGLFTAYTPNSFQRRESPQATSQLAISTRSKKNNFRRTAGRDENVYDLTQPCLTTEYIYCQGGRAVK